METASTRDRPKLREALGKLQVGDTLVIYKPDRVARSMKELLVLLEDQLYARGINLHILTGICAGIHRPDGATIADKMLFMVAAMAAEMERDLIRERTLDGLRAAEAQGRRGGRRPAIDEDVLAVDDVHGGPSLPSLMSRVFFWPFLSTLKPVMAKTSVYADPSRLTQYDWSTSSPPCRSP